MNCNTYIFSGCDCAADSCEGNEYARTFVVPTPYCDTSDPPEALRRGTMFNALYKPYCPEVCHEC